LSLCCTGVGLNLQDASHRIIFTTPSYVPADELQGIGRVVRHGQEQPVVIYRFLVDPFDTRAMSIQFAKMAVMEQTHGGYGDAGLPLLMLGDAVREERMLLDAADASGSGSGTAVEQAEAETEDSEDEDRPSKRSKGKGKGKAKARPSKRG